MQEVVVMVEVAAATATSMPANMTQQPIRSGCLNHDMVSLQKYVGRSN